MNIFYSVKLIPDAKTPIFGFRVLSTVWTIVNALATFASDNGALVLFYWILVFLKIWSDHTFRTKVTERNP